MKRFEMRWWLLTAGGVLLLTVVWQLLTGNFAEEEKAVLSEVRETVMTHFPVQAGKYSESIGIFRYQQEGEDVGRDRSDLQTVVLVHGLDDPGKIWQDLAPALTHEGFDVWLMNYPNDQPIADSSRLLLAELRKLSAVGKQGIAMVAHSMGGLVCRDLLTNPEIGYDLLVQQEKVAKVDWLIMVGTPNHGSQMARLRIFSEARDQLDRLFNGKANPLGFILDGAGEARIDLLPGSSFLTELNGRKNPESINMLVIAGITTPWSEKDVTHWLEKAKRFVGQENRREVDAVGQFLLSMSHELGDGLVTLESTRLPGIPHLKVSGTHLSMIRNLAADSDRIPPAVPIIIDTLKKEP
ncbi:MAG: esterase/lipase family protein [Desulforhopalus sp.]